MSVLSADVVVVGAGPSGLAAAWRLATGGASVLCIDQGSYFSPPEVDPGTPQFAALRESELNPNPNIRRATVDMPVDDAESAVAPMIGNGVGGGSIYWSAHVPRFRPDDFAVRSHDGVGADWPLGYGELAPYYRIYEQQIGSAYKVGAPDLPAREPSSRPLPPLYPAAKRMAAVFDRLGWQWWPVDLARGREAGATRCRHAGPCDIGCPSWRAATADAAFLEDAVAHGLRLITETRAVRIVHDLDGRVTGLECRRGGEAITIRAGHVVLAAGGLATPWLMLVSRSDRFPHGVGNTTGQLGRGMMLHPYGWTRGYFEGLKDRDATPGAGIMCTQFRPTDARSGAIRGVRLQTAQEPSQRALDGSHDGRGGWMAISICAEDLPEPENRITLSDDLRTQDGLPAPKMVYRVSENSRRLLAFGADRAIEALRLAGATDIEHTPLKHQAGFHIMGTARMGEDPATAVVDAEGRCHDARDLIIADASVFVTGSVMNPTATAGALAIRAAGGLLQARANG